MSYRMPPPPVTIMDNTAMTDVEQGEPVTPKSDGDDIARRILDADGPLPTGSIGSLTRAWERLMESNPETFPLMRAVMEVLERIDKIDNSTAITHGKKPAALWKSLGYRPGSGRRNGQREFVITTLVDMYEWKYAEGNAPRAALTKAIAKVAELAGTSPQVVKNLRQRQTDSDLEWDPRFIPQFQKLLADSITSN